MIGVIANPLDEWVVREFFELFKTPWEFYRRDQRYEVVLCAGDVNLDGVHPKLLLLFAGQKTAFDGKQKIEVKAGLRCTTLSYGRSRLPIYGDSIAFRIEDQGILTDAHSRDSVAYAGRLGDGMFARIGYDLFREVQILLSIGQPAANAGIPTLELHIELVRDLISGCGVPFVEVPPVPEGYSFIACLTHDVDHASIRRHGFDHTVLGFLHRAILGSVINVGRGRLPLRKLFTNWAAAAKWPFIHLGLARDFWFDFDRYLAIEKGKPSTFFVIPFEGRPGHTSKGPAPRARSTRYDISHIASKIQQLMASGCEIGLHGIDAWADSSRGREEANRITAVSGTAEIGVRMHWLYSNQESPVKLENAGFSYDSTVGYNETVGYRAGTGQAFKPLRATRLLELPMHVMDTALFYPGYLNLSAEEAWIRLGPVLDNAIRYGGALTINWHDRSLSPERLWGDVYARLVEDMAARGAWFGSAAQTVSWFRKRRSVVFEKSGCDGNRIQAKVTADYADDLPPLRLRMRSGRNSPESVAATASANDYVDATFGENTVPSGPVIQVPENRLRG